jgi:hypothetical protein
VQKVVRFGCAFRETEQQTGYHKRRFSPNIFLSLQRQAFPSGKTESEAFNCQRYSYMPSGSKLN